MPYSVKTLEHFHLQVTDGEIGNVSDFYFDDQHWTIRYLVVNTGNWLTGKSVLISPISVQKLDQDKRHVLVALTQDQVRHSPDVDTEQPVSRQKEMELAQYYQWTPYWGGGMVWGSTMFPASVGGVPLTPPPPGTTAPPPPAASPTAPPSPPAPEAHPADSHLRSTDEVTGYVIHARDGEIGHVEDFLFDEQSWTIQNLVVHTSTWFGKKVLIPPSSIESIDWDSTEVRVGLTRDEVRQRPIYEPGSVRMF